MELSIHKSDFVRGLTRAHGVADRKSSMPILSNILISTEGKDRVRLSATDLYIGISCLIPAEIKTGGSVAVSARTLYEIARNLPEREVSLTVGENRATEIRCGKVRYKLPGMPGDEFPPLPNAGDVEFSELPSETIAELIGLTHYSMSKDDTRPHLAGSLFEHDGQIVRMVTTDGHRLSKAEMSLGDGEADRTFQMLVPHKGIEELRRVLEDSKGGRSKEDSSPSSLGIATAAGSAFFRRDGLQLSIKLAEDQFPPYSKVIPQQQTRKVIAARPLMVESLRRISLVANDKSGGVQLHIEPGLLRITSQNPDVGEGSEELDVDYAGDPVKIGFNARYLLEVLTSMPNDEIALELSGELDPGVVKPVGDGVDFVGVIMPMRI